MPLTTSHPDFDKSSRVWQRCRDVAAGEDAVKSNAIKYGYLPKLDGQTVTEYDGYRTRAMFYNATGRTIQAVVGAIFRKPLVIEPEPGNNEDGKSRADTLTDVARSVTAELFEVGRVGILADVPKEGGDPYLLVYKTEQIINWRYEVKGDQQKITRVVLREVTHEENSDDPYVLEEVERFRELVLEGGVYHHKLWRKAERKDGDAQQKEEWVIEDDVTPVALGNVMTEIPFIIIGQQGIDACVVSPPLLDMVNVNLSHFRTSADLEHGRHFTALPTAWVAGFASESELKIGSGTAWVTDNASARAGFLEFTGAGLGHLATALEQKEHLMAVLGARLFEPPKAQVEAAETVRLRQSAETATASNMARVVGAAMTKAYRLLSAFVRGAAVDTAKIEVPSDVLDQPMQMDSLTALVAAWQAGAISYDTLLYNLKQGEILPPDRTIDDEKVLVQEDDVRFMREERASQLKQEEVAAAAAAKGPPNGTARGK